jgi:hypothetical protein
MSWQGTKGHEMQWFACLRGSRSRSSRSRSSRSRSRHCVNEGTLGLDVFTSYRNVQRGRWGTHRVLTIGRIARNPAACKLYTWT